MQKKAAAKIERDEFQKKNDDFDHRITILEKIIFLGGRYGNENFKNPTY